MKNQISFEIAALDSQIFALATKQDKTDQDYAALDRLHQRLAEIGESEEYHEWINDLIERGVF